MITIKAVQNYLNRVVPKQDQIRDLTPRNNLRSIESMGGPVRIEVTARHPKHYTGKNHGNGVIEIHAEGRRHSANLQIGLKGEAPSNEGFCNFDFTNKTMLTPMIDDEGRTSRLMEQLTCRERMTFKTGVEQENDLKKYKIHPTIAHEYCQMSKADHEPMSLTANLETRPPDPVANELGLARCTFHPLLKMLDEIISQSIKP